MASSIDSQQESRDAWWRSSPGPWIVGGLLLVGFCAGALFTPIATLFDSQLECQVDSQKPVVLQGCDLRGAELRSAELAGVDLRGAFLEGADLTGANLRGADLTGANLAGALLIQADLAGADLEGATARGANFTNACLDGIDSATLERLGLLAAAPISTSSAPGKGRPCDS